MEGCSARTLCYGGGGRRPKHTDVLRPPSPAKPRQAKLSPATTWGKAVAGLRQGSGKVAEGLPSLLALGFGQGGPGQAKPSAEPTGRQEQDLG